MFNKEDDYNKFLSRFSEKYDFHICNENEINLVVEFIEKYWKKDHALVISRDLMEWQHHDKLNSRYNFVIAKDKISGDIHALQGFILSSQYDCKINKPIRWAAIWKNRDDVGVPGLGLMVHLFAIHNIPALCYGSFGISDISFPIYKKLDDKIGCAIQWYMLNPNKTDFKLVDNYNSAMRYNKNAIETSGTFVNCNVNDYMSLDDSFLNYIPQYKSKKYYVNRYFNHPIYKYNAIKICDSNKIPQAIFFWRICTHEGARCIRIVDYFGLNYAMSGHLDDFLLLLIREDAEFIDFINVGIDKKYFEDAGFIDRNTTDIILANYFEPFLLKNIELKYAFNSEEESEKPLFFKGDSDQDRPNLLEK